MRRCGTDPRESNNAWGWTERRAVREKAATTTLVLLHRGDTNRSKLSLLPSLAACQDLVPICLSDSQGFWDRELGSGRSGRRRLLDIR